ncbi:MULTISPECIES: pseudouridine synthase [unclassified Rhizobium]|uniref:pseudouridine synthase n=1 Tax=unclassified Rhizobium TaxID=2613769 RepID=UPI000EAA7833|nr:MULTISPECIES: pseudouridine synthase [unclassified Rhizobium]AYG65325.1 pseudouridine synthase [Rhizobium sp. CCGE531]AYG71809.1 pseudouridine synthase [Rhizobium sp. CCGE532]
MTMNDKPKRPGPKPFARDKQMKSDGAKPAKAATVKAADETVAGDGKAERISKVMARAGVASRRDIERMIMDGRVRLNGVPLDTPVVNVTLADKIEVDGVPIRGIERTRLWLYHKPAGLVTTNADPEGRPTVFDNLPEELPRVMSIGRLDINTEGLLLLTNDGGLARVLELPTTGWLRRYRVRAHGEIDQEALDKLKEGIAVDGVLYGSIEATLDRTQGSNVWITMGLREGKNREIKNVLGALGLEVNRLIRISYGPFQLGELPEGHVLEVRGRTLRDQLGPRLVEDAKANFDAPLYNAPAVAEAEEVDAKPVRTVKEERPRRDRERPEDKRERALSRLDTKRDAKRDDRREGGRDGGHKDDDRQKRQPLGPRRSANVWMAPGARPLGEKAAAKAAKNVKTASRRGEPERPQRSGFDRPDEGPRVRVNRVAEADGEWIRSSEEAPRTGRGDDQGSDRKRSDRPRGDRPFGDRPPRGDRPFGDKPRGDRPYGDKPRGSRPEGGDRPRAKSFDGEGRSERPRGDRPFGDRPPRGDRPFGDKPRGDRPYGDKPRGDRPYGERRPRAEGDERPRARAFDGEQRSERPRGDRPFGDRPPRGDRPFGDRPQGERSFGDRPAGKPFGKKPGGGKSFGGKPGGKPGGSRGFGGKPGGAGRPSGGPRGGSGRGGPGRGGPKGGRG